MIVARSKIPPKPAARGRAPDLRRAAALFLVVFAISFLGYSRTLPPTADEMIDFGLAESIAKWGVFSIDQISTVGPNPEEFGLGGHRYSKYGPLQAVLSVPLYLAAEHLPIGATDTVLLLNHLVTALATALLYLLVRRLGYGMGVALAIAAIACFGTPLWVDAKRYLAEPTITLCFVGVAYAAYAAATTGNRRWLAATGLAFGLSVAAKYIDALLLAPVPLYLAWSAIGAGLTPRPPSRRGKGEGARERSCSTRRIVHDDGPDQGAEVAPCTPPSRAGKGAGGLGPTRLAAALRALFWFGVGVAPVAALLMAYDQVRFGSPLVTGYAHWEGFTTPVWDGLSGFLVSPGKSLFVYTPLFLLLPFWGPRFVRSFPGFSACLGAIIALHLVVYGSWWVWWGAWTWGPRFIVPILPLLAIALSPGLADLTGTRGRSEPHPLGDSASPRPLVWAIVVILGLLSLGIQVLGIAVDHTIYMAQLLPLNPRPDTLTLWDVRYSPILHQVPLLTRQYLDFAWIERTGPSVVNLAALVPALGGAVAALLGFVLVWRTTSAPAATVVLLAATVLVGFGAYRALRSYDGTVDPDLNRVVAALAQAPPDAAVVQLIPDEVVPFANWQKRPLPELGWIDEPRPNPIITRRLDDFAARFREIWVVTDTPPKAPSNGVEARLDRSLALVGDQAMGRFRLLRYVTHPNTLPLVSVGRRFAPGITLVGYTASGPAVPGGQVDLVLAWQAEPTEKPRADYTVFVHLVDGGGKLVAQHDDPPADGYAPTGRWAAGEVVYDDHAIAIPDDAPSGLRLVQVGLYLPATGQRIPLVGPDGKPAGDTVTLDLGGAAALAGR